MYIEKDFTRRNDSCCTLMPIGLNSSLVWEKKLSSVQLFLKQTQALAEIKSAMRKMSSV